MHTHARTRAHMTITVEGKALGGIWLFLAGKWIEVANPWLWKNSKTLTTGLACVDSIKQSGWSPTDSLTWWMEAMNDMTKCRNYLYFPIFSPLYITFHLSPSNFPSTVLHLFLLRTYGTAAVTKTRSYNCKTSNCKKLKWIHTKKMSNHRNKLKWIRKKYIIHLHSWSLDETLATMHTVCSHGYEGIYVCRIGMLGELEVSRMRLGTFICSSW